MPFKTIVAVVVACPLSERSYNCGRVLCESENKQSIIAFAVVRGFDCLASELYSLVAQLVERSTVNRKVVGSNPTQRARA